ncbi:uncharacterized protein BDZ83DRAFT_753075 [Colletotrichum acutatum]|uniref:Uncharacterized protein n=1 Tax=Glomerella acutata TaxID=27357 RepID=A0AAD8UMS6_GLOAC|nr:uncharacterized protein BDZ83DRAFT_753075 [Colletotrichum acutatum]KAK1723954.1 hypothetical protein BDZ83DRAFT_753075 [Colletotrichum acutatum]
MAAVAVTTFSPLGRAEGAYPWTSTQQSTTTGWAEEDVRIRLRMIARAWESASHNAQVRPETFSSAVMVFSNSYLLWNFVRAGAVPAWTPQRSSPSLTAYRSLPWLVRKAVGRESGMND